ncbi:MAG: DUF1127 domain-containing protein [Sneathiella sp.]|nr:DUF1127 domain-containing protein [Sneathiella sp.]
MMSYSKKDIAALALIEPVKANNNYIDTDALVHRAHVLRSEYFAAQVAALYDNTVGKYLRHRDIEAARNSLYAMSDRELHDIGITRSEIDRAVEGKTEMETVKKSGFWKSLAGKFIEAQKARAAYVHLMAMNTRELADIGLTRGEIAAAVNGNKKALANDNLAQPSNNNDHRRAV